ncbi:MAG: hydrogenase formation protein HypD [Chloroflexota bacterium]
MKYIDEFRDPALARWLLDDIAARSTQPVNLMEFCGGHTHAIFKFGIRQLLPDTVRLLSGPGCPVCVTANADLDRAIAIAWLPEVITATFGDMLKVPGSRTSLQAARAGGADVRMIYSTLDAVQMAQQNPERRVVFLGVGFETTAPTIAAAVLQAEALGLDNFCVLSMHKLTPPATQAILRAGEVRLSGIIGPGHVTTVIGSEAWQFLPRDHGIPVAVAGFEPLDILRAVRALVEQVESGRPGVINTYSRSVRPEGNRTAVGVMDRVFEVSDAGWRGFGSVPQSGLSLRPAYARFDAARVFDVDPGPVREHKGCRCGEVLRGVVSPPECPLFRRTCTPQNPIGPCMVSAEGACAAHYLYGEEI